MKFRTYLPRQVLGREIKNRSEKIPQFWNTGNGSNQLQDLEKSINILLEVKPEFKNNYSLLTDEPQDWVKRQLSGIKGAQKLIPGVVF
jgi:cobalt-zinc-cadmium resistance protein CzcA